MSREFNMTTCRCTTAAALCVAALALSPSARAESCGVRSFEDRFHAAQLVFRGVVQEVTDDCTFDCFSADPQYPFAVVPVTYGVSTVWKGEVRAEQLLVDTMGAFSSVHPPPGDDLLVFAEALHDTGSFIARCDGHVPWAEADGAFAVLGDGSPPLEGASDAFVCPAPYVSVVPAGFVAPACAEPFSGDAPDDAPARDPDAGGARAPEPGGGPGCSAAAPGGTGPLALLVVVLVVVLGDRRRRHGKTPRT